MMHYSQKIHADISIASAPIAGQDYESHLMGTHTFVKAQDYHQQSAIQQAAIRVVLRQEIVYSFRTQQPVRLLQEYIQVNESLNPDKDSSTAFHLFVLCAEALTLCYGSGQKTPEAWEELEGRVQAWMDTKPVTFEPLLKREPNESLTGNVFPEIWLLNDCSVAAYSHYYICQILLVAHNPRRPQLGPRRAKAAEASNVSHLYSHISFIKTNSSHLLGHRISLGAMSGISAVLLCRIRTLRHACSLRQWRLQSVSAISDHVKV